MSITMERGLSVVRLIFIVFVLFGVGLIFFSYRKSKKTQESSSSDEIAKDMQVSVRENDVLEKEKSPDIDFEKEFQIGRRANLD